MLHASAAAVAIALFVVGDQFCPRGAGSAFAQQPVVASTSPVVSASVGRPTVETAGESNIKAVYLYSFGRFTTWPGFRETTPEKFTIGVVGSTGVSGSLRKIAQKRTVQSRQIDVKEFFNASEVVIGNCQMLFIAASVSDQDAAMLLERLQGTSVLTVTETLSRPHGTVVNFVPQDAKIIFEINIEEAKKKDLAMDARLLRQGKRMQPNEN